MEGGAQVVVISYHQKSEAAQGQVQDYHLFLHLLLKLSIQIISLDQSSININIKVNRSDTKPTRKEHTGSSFDKTCMFNLYP